MDKSHPAIVNRLSRRTGDTYLWPYPEAGGVYKKAGNDLYALVIHSYHHREKKTDTNVYDNVYLRSYKLTSGSWKQASELDLSDCIRGRALRSAMRLIDNTLVVCVRDSFAVVDVANPAEPKQVDKKLDVLRGNRSLAYEDRKKEFSVPLIPAEQLGIEERVKLSIDLIYRFSITDNDIYESSIVDAHDGKFAFFSASGRDVARFDVIRWDQENIYCRFGASRPFTILESLSGESYDEYSALVEDGKLYCRRRNTLLVFDIRSGRRIRKLGHFVRMDCHIDDMSILDDSNILLSARWWVSSGGSGSRKQKKFLYLLKNPE